MKEETTPTTGLQVEITPEQFELLTDIEKRFYEPKASTTCNSSTKWERNVEIKKYVPRQLTLNDIAQINADSIQDLGYGFTITDVRTIAKNFFISGANYTTAPPSNQKHEGGMVLNGMICGQTCGCWCNEQCAFFHAPHITSKQIDQYKARIVELEAELTTYKTMTRSLAKGR